MNETSKNETGKERKRGGQQNNRNRMRHGLRAGKLPRGSAYIEIQTNKLRIELENAVVAVKGSVSLSDAASIQTACRWERTAKLAERWLRIEGDKMTRSERLRYEEMIPKASESRDKAIARLQLDRDDSNRLIDALYLPVPEDNGKDDDES